MRRFIQSLCFLVFFIPFTGKALVKYNEGRMLVMGVQLLQDHDDPNSYYYLPQFPQLASKVDDTPEFLCLKYVGQDGQPSGGLFHALIEFTLPEELLIQVQAKLEEEKPGAQIVGPVPLMENRSDDGDGTAGFEIVSAILSDTDGEQAFTRTVITSGHAPLLPGSKTAIAANLSPEGATLLWNSLSGPTSDVSATIHAYYEATVKAYNAIVTAEMDKVYEHYSRVYNYQQGYTRRQLRDITDEMKNNGVLKVEVFDRTKGLDIKSTEISGILQLVTDKLTELMFNSETGWAKDPEREKAVEANQILGRQKKSWLSRTFGGTKNTAYYSDDQYVLKKRTDIQTNRFYLNLSQSTTVKVPVHTSGNLAGIFNELGDDARFFRIVDLGDPAFQKREVFFQVDGEFANAFADLINFVSVNFRKKYPDQSEVTKELIFNHDNVSKGEQLQSASFPRLGIKGSEWIDYEYRVEWSLKDREELISVPVQKNKWEQSNSPIVLLKPPLKKEVIEIDADRSLFKDAGIANAVVEFASSVGGELKKIGRIYLKGNDAESTSKISLYHDDDEKIVYRISWYAKSGTYKQQLQELDSDYLFIMPPSVDKFE